MGDVPYAFYSRQVIAQDYFIDSLIHVWSPDDTALVHLQVHDRCNEAVYDMRKGPLPVLLFIDTQIGVGWFQQYLFAIEGALYQTRTAVGIAYDGNIPFFAY